MAFRLCTTDWDLRTLWTCYSLQTKFYLCLLFAAALYSTFSLLKILFRLHAARSSAPDSSSATFPRDFSHRLSNLGQFHLLLLLLFGLFLTDAIVGTLQAISHSHMMLGVPPLAGFADPILIFVSVCLLILTFLHSLQWFVSARLNAFARRRELS